LFYGVYHAATTSQTGCVKQFATLAADRPSFPPQVNYRCDLCHSEHGFRLVRSMMVSTPSQHSKFETYCVSQQIERDVRIP
jgi:hypothetical protein